MKIGIIGTRGIPNQFGGFEQFADIFSAQMAERGHQVTVYSSSLHPFKEKKYGNVELIHCYDPENILGTFGQFIYDLNCILDSRKQNFDIILQLGYTSSTIWSWLYPRSALLVTNMDGLEWSRAKYNKVTQYFLRQAERWGVRFSNYLIADSEGIKEYLKDKYKVDALFVPYGADIYNFEKDDFGILKRFGLNANEYDLVIARFEPENNIETILRSYANKTRKLILIGNYSATRYGRRMFMEYGAMPQFQFAGAIYDIDHLNVLRSCCRLYLHGHSVGGTNPSLLEAMACNSIICAHDNPFNKDVLGENAFYFNNVNELVQVINSVISKNDYEGWLRNNKQKILNIYNWEKITSKIESNFKQWKSAEQYLPVVGAV